MYRGQTLHVREMYRGKIAVCKMEITLIYILFAEQLTRTFEVLVGDRGTAPPSRGNNAAIHLNHIKCSTLDGITLKMAGIQSK